MWKQVVVILAVGLMASPGFARKRYRVPADQSKIEKSVSTEKVPGLPDTKNSQKPFDSALETVPSSKGIDLWGKGKETVIQLKGQAIEESASCKSFQIQIATSLSYKIDCVGHEKSESIDLKSAKNQTVTQNSGHLTITKYNYLMKKTQVTRLQQSTLKVPFVEQIIHIKKLKNGQLSFYFESFKEDEFGRIVQDSFVQAHSLAHKKMKISAN